MPFVVPPWIRTICPHTECMACGAEKQDHGPDGECPEGEEA